MSWQERYALHPLSLFFLFLCACFFLGGATVAVGVAPSGVGEGRTRG